VPSIVIPAHNEEAVLGRLLSELLAGAAPGEFEVVVIANGCTDATAEVASAFGDQVRVVSTPVPSKCRALRLGDEHANTFPRLYVDADVRLDTASARRLFAALDAGHLLAAAPRRVLDLAASSRTVRWYYDVWQRLPTVRTGLYGRGVIGVSALGYERLASLPEIMGDDLAASISFGPPEAAVVPDAAVVVLPPRTTADLIRRRVRAATVVAQLHQHLPTAVDAARTTRADLARLLASEPLLAPKLVAFLAVTVVARRRSRAAVRAGDFDSWLRDESSRAGGTAVPGGPAGETR
jgi:hypothetical protein